MTVSSASWTMRSDSASNALKKNKQFYSIFYAAMLDNLTRFWHPWSIGVTVSSAGVDMSHENYF